MKPLRKIRIFISSPGDVKTERELARQVVQSLRRRYAGKLDIEAVLWEKMPLQSDMSFQQGIDVILSEKGVEVAVFILWSRLGSPTGPLVVDGEGKPFRSGTEREYYLIMEARKQTRDQGLPVRPQILLYTRRDEGAYEERFRNTSDEAKEEMTRQKKLVKSFLDEQLKDSESKTNKGAHHNYGLPSEFQRTLRGHLEALLDIEAGQGEGDPVWDIASQGSPYLGLAAYQPEHAPIFLGREDEIVEIRQSLRMRAAEGSAFVLISGASGSGKSSLARAGVLPAILEHEVDEQVTKWHSLIVQPGELGDWPAAGLAAKLGHLLPGIGPQSGKFPDFCIKLRSEPEFAVRHFLRDALPARERIVLLVDQMEEIFTMKGITDPARQEFAGVLSALARSGFVWILATMRSDFSHHCQSVPTLVRLREGRGQVDLLAPTADALARVIEDPTRLAGLHYERDAQGVALSDRLLRDATEHRELLPFLSHILRVLVEERTPEGKLTFASYRRQLGTLPDGKDGDFRTALATYAENVVKEMPKATQEKLEALWPKLITLGGDDGMQALRQYPAKESLITDETTRHLVDALIEARLLTASDRGVTIVHETLFRSWDRAAKWIDKNRDMLRVRSSIERSMAEWERSEPQRVKKRDKSLLLPLGLPLRQAKDLLKKHGAVPIDHVRDYIRRSLRRARRIRLMQLWFVPAAVVLWLGYLGWLKMAENDIAARGAASEAELANPARVPTPMPQVDPKRETTDHPRFINGVGMEMIWCGPGEFVMGSTIDADEKPHRVKLTRGFWLARHEFTWASYARLVKFQGGDTSKIDPAHTPLGNINWDQCRDVICDPLTEVERAAGRIPAGWEYALPTEAQWEYACRAGTTTEFSFGNALDGRHANCNGKQPHGTFLHGLFLNKFTTVGSYPANPWGFYDMHGNVAEWCFDAYEEDITGRTLDPQVDSDEQGARRVYRGGLADDLAVDCRAALRGRHAPSFAFDALGLRPALVPSQPAR